MFMGDEQQYPSEPDVGGSGDSRNLRLEAKDKGTAQGVGTWASPPGHPPQDFLCAGDLNSATWNDGCWMGKPKVCQ